MMTNLFSSFDPSSSLFIPFNWMSATLFLTIVTPMFWKLPTKKNSILFTMMNTMHLEFKTLLATNNINGATIILASLFLFILLNNFLGLFPYIFTASSHISLTLALALPIWISLMMFGWFNNTMHMFAHLVPSGTPSALMPFMVLIETVSNVIRPITLSVRLMANMVAGHLLMTLLGNQTAAASNITLVGLLITQILLLTLESAVAIIQSYVFVILSTLYSSEVISH